MPVNWTTNLDKFGRNGQISRNMKCQDWIKNKHKIWTVQSLVAFNLINSQKKKNSRLDGFTGEFCGEFTGEYQTYKEKLISLLLNPFQKIEEDETLPNLFYEDTIL